MVESTSCGDLHVRYIPAGGMLWLSVCCWCAVTLFRGCWAIVIEASLGG